jgi:hypothetical protein
MMMMTMVRGLYGPGGAALGSRLHVGLQLGKSALRGAQVAGVESLAKSGEVVLKRVAGRGLATGLIAW